MRHWIRSLFGKGAAVDAPPANKHLWSIGLYAGASPLALRPMQGITNPVLTREQVLDIPSAFVADPFLVRSRDRWHLFFEAYDRRSGLGVIALATSMDLRTWQYGGVVLAEEFHLSYPHVFEHAGAWYMIPETHKAESVRLYRAADFPRRWELQSTLLAGRKFGDTTVFEHDGRWWMLTETSPDRKNHTLRLYSSASLHEGWEEHPASPIVEGNQRIARPAGPVVKTSQGLFRFAQDCEGAYGKSIRVLKIETLTTSEYKEAEVEPSPCLSGAGTGWNANGMHHVSACQLEDGSWIAAVDGWRAVTAAVIRGE